jgi:hypothetical protein
VNVEETSFLKRNGRQKKYQSKVECRGEPRVENGQDETQKFNKI